MPQRKSVRFEDIDDEPEGGFGLKVSQSGRPSIDSLGLALGDGDDSGLYVMWEAPPSHPAHAHHQHTTSTTPTTNNNQGILTNLYATLSGYGKWARTHSKTALSWGVTIGWYIATATIITAMPLLLEVRPSACWCVCDALLGFGVACTDTPTPPTPPPTQQLQREQAVIEMEKVQVKELLAQGYPPAELQRMGMTLEPSVLQEAGKQK